MGWLISGGMVLWAWLTPLHLPPWISWHSEAAVFAAVMCAMAGLLFGKGSSTRPVEIPYAAWPLMLLALVAVVQTMTGHITFAGDAWVLLMYFTVSGFALTIGFSGVSRDSLSVGETRGKDEWITLFAVMVVLGGVASVIIACIQALNVWEWATWMQRMPGLRRPGGNITQPNQLGTLILFALASLVYLYELRKLGEITTGMLALLLLFGLAITESRTGALNVLFLASWWWMKRKNISSRISLPTVGAALVFYVGCFWFWPSWMNGIQMGEAGNPKLTEVDMNAGGRLVAWPQLWEAIQLRPLFGWGLREVSEGHNAVLDHYSRSENYTYAHNIVLDLAVGMGLPLTLVLVVVVGRWVWQRMRAADNLLTWYCLAFALPFGVHSMLEFPFAYAYLLIPPMVVIGVLEARQKAPQAVRIRWRSIVGIWVAVCAVMVWSVIEYLQIEEDFRVARFEVLQLGETPGSYERPRIYLLTQLDALLEGTRLAPKPGMTPERIQLAHDVAMRFPGPATQMRYAATLALNGMPDEARRQLQVMRAMHDEYKYADIKRKWDALGKDRYPELKQIALP